MLVTVQCLSGRVSAPLSVSFYFLFFLFDSLFLLFPFILSILVFYVYQIIDFPFFPFFSPSLLPFFCHSFIFCLSSLMNHSDVDSIAVCLRLPTRFHSIETGEAQRRRGDVSVAPWRGGHEGVPR